MNDRVTPAIDQQRHARLQPALGLVDHRSDVDMARLRLYRFEPRAARIARTRLRRGPALRPGQHPLRDRHAQHDDLDDAQCRALLLRAGAGQSHDLRLSQLRASRQRHRNGRRGAARHVLVLLQRRRPPAGAGCAMGEGDRRPGALAGRRQSPPGDRPRRCGRQRRAQGTRARALQRPGTDGTRAEDQVRRTSSPAWVRRSPCARRGSQKCGTRSSPAAPRSSSGRCSPRRIPTWAASTWKRVCLPRAAAPIRGTRNAASGACGRASWSRSTRTWWARSATTPTFRAASSAVRGSRAPSSASSTASPTSKCITTSRCSVPASRFASCRRAHGRRPTKFAPLAAGVVIHGIGMCNEYPQVYPGAAADRTGYDGVLEPNMTVCVESYIGEKGGIEGVKLEQMVLVTENGPELLSLFPVRGRSARLKRVRGKRLGRALSLLHGQLAEDPVAHVAAHHDRRASPSAWRSSPAFPSASPPRRTGASRASCSTRRASS